MNPQANNESNQSILDAIKEQTTNIERVTTNSSTDNILIEALRELALREKVTRESTVTIKNDASLDFEKTSNLIMQEWTIAKQQTPATYWKDRENTYIQFLNKAVKEVFIDFARSKEALAPVAANILPPNSDGQHITRKEVRIIMSAVPENVDPDKIEDTLKSLTSRKTSIGKIRAGKSYGTQARKVRSLMTSVNAEGFRLIFKSLNGSIPYNDPKTKIRVFPKIACKPWACRDCYYIGPNHSCEGKACGQCGNKGHTSKECKSKTRYCTNCKRQGHRAKDAHCPTYIREVIKEIKRMDIPVEFLESETKRQELLRCLIYK